MPGFRTRLLSVSEPACDGSREWRFCVVGASRAFLTVSARNREEATAALQAQIGSGALHQLGDGKTGAAVTVGIVGAAAFVAYRIGLWWWARVAGAPEPKHCGCATPPEDEVAADSEG